MFLSNSVDMMKNLPAACTNAYIAAIKKNTYLIFYHRLQDFQNGSSVSKKMPGKD